MNRSFLGSLRVRLILVVLLAVIPALGVIYYNAREQRETALGSAREHVLRIARLTAANNTRVVEGARQMLAALAELPEVRGDDPARCRAALERFLKVYGFYSNLGVAMPDGRVGCSAVPLAGAVSVRDDLWFQQALKSREFTIGGYEPDSSRLSGKPAVNFGYPIAGSDDQVRSMVFASLDLAELGWQMSSVLPLGEAEVALVDRNGVVLAQAGGEEDRVGRPLPEAGQIKELASRRGSVADLWYDTSGVERIYAMIPVGSKRGDADLYVATSARVADALGEADYRLKRNLAALGIAALLALAAAWFGGAALVLRQSNEELERRVEERAKELAHEQFLLQTLLDNVPDSIYFKDKEGRFLRSSRAQAKRFGLTDPSQAVGKTDFDFFKKEHAEQAFADEQQIIQTGQPLVNIEEYSPLADGTERWVSTSKLPLRDKQGNIVGTFGISREITERKRAEQALVQERNLLRTLIDNIPDLVFIKDTQGRYSFDNAAHRAFLMVSAIEDVVGKTAFDFYPKDLAAAMSADDQAALRAEVPILHREETLTNRQGQRFRARTSKIPYRDEQRKVVGLVCISELLDHPK
jgi:PAS domain S-box-containing protein